MRFVSLLGLLCLSAVGFFGQSDEVTFHADQMTRNGSVVSLKGNVRVTAKGVTVYADQADYNYVTGDLIPQGRVQIKLLERHAAAKEPPADTADPSDTPLQMPKDGWQQRH